VKQTSARSMPVIVGMVALSCALGSLVLAHAQGPPAGHWVTAWGSSLQGLAPSTTVSNATVRMIARVTIPGDAVRVRIDNSFGTKPLRISRAVIGHRTTGAVVAKGSGRQILFKGAGAVTIAAGGSALSDAVAITVRAWQDVAVSLHIPDADVVPSQHNGAFATSYFTANNAGDVTEAEAQTPFTQTTTSMFWLKALEVQTTSTQGAIVAFGDSITDGTCSTVDAHDRWVDWLSVRLYLDAQNRKPGGSYKAVVNEGISGNTIGREHIQPPPDSPPGLERLERDVLTHNGITDVIVFMGTNDIRREASAAEVMKGLETIVTRVKARGLKVTGVTIIPRHDVPASGTNTGWNAAKSAISRQVNTWMMSSGKFDHVIDFAEVVRDPANPTLIDPAYNCDGIHPTPRGYYEMGNALNLNWFR
jgi:lysophospholipase L1-like esterase